MIGLILILLVIETLTALWLINQLNIITQNIAIADEEIKNSGFNGSLTLLKLSLRNFNKKLASIKLNQKSDYEMEKMTHTVNFVLILLSVYRLIFSKKRIEKFKNQSKT